MIRIWVGVSADGQLVVSQSIGPIGVGLSTEEFLERFRSAKQVNAIGTYGVGMTVTGVYDDASLQMSWDAWEQVHQLRH